MASQTQLLQNELSLCHEQIDRLNQSLEERSQRIQELADRLVSTQNLLTEQMRLNHNLNIFVASIKDGLETLNKSKPTVRIEVG